MYIQLQNKPVIFQLHPVVVKRCSTNQMFLINMINAFLHLSDLKISNESNLKRKPI